MPVTVFLVAGVGGKRGRAFCFLGEWRCRAVVMRVCRVARLVASARAASSARDVAAVTFGLGHRADRGVPGDGEGHLIGGGRPAGGASSQGARAATSGSRVRMKMRVSLNNQR